MDHRALDPMTDSAGLPVPEPRPITIHAPVLLRVPGRAVDLSLRVMAPAAGGDLPAIVFSHGHGGSMYNASMYGYDPLTLFWAAHGFVVIQPGHLDSNYLGLRDADTPDAPLYLHARAADLIAVIDRLDDIEDAVPGLAGRLDHSRIAAVGHSAGGNTVGLVSGMSILHDGATVSRIDPRIGARVLIAPPGQGSDLGEWATEHYPALGSTDFAGMTPPALVVVGENDATELFAARRDWRSDAFASSPGPKTRLTMPQAEHMLGGISGFDVAETSDESPERVALVRTLVWAYLRSALDPGDTAWDDTQHALAEHSPGAARIDTK